MEHLQSDILFAHSKNFILFAETVRKYVRSSFQFDTSFAKKYPQQINCSHWLSEQVTCQLIFKDPNPKIFDMFHAAYKLIVEWLSSFLSG